MKASRRYRKAERALARQSKKLAEEQLRFTTPERMAASVSEYIEWNAFAYWARLLVEREGYLVPEVHRYLEIHSPGLLQDLAGYTAEQLHQPAFFWKRLMAWLFNKEFRFAKAEGWLHALGYYATRDPRMHVVSDYWFQCDERWKHEPPAVLPTFEQWKQAAAALAKER